MTDQEWLGVDKLIKGIEEDLFDAGVFQGNEQMNLISKVLQKHAKQFLIRLNKQLSVNKEHARAILDLSIKLNHSAESLSDNTVVQANQLEEAEKTLSTIISQVSHNSEIAKHTSLTAEASADIAEQGQAIVNDMADKMKEIKVVFLQSIEAMERLEHSSSTVGGIVSTIEALAKKSNLLALNAAIEAARAGQYGKGFAVVANEVGTLSQQTSEATRKIEAIIEKIRTEIGSASESINEGNLQVEDGVGLADKATSELDKILDSSVETQKLVSQIATTSENQTGMIKDLFDTIHEITDLANRSTSNLANFSEGINEIDATSSVIAWGLQVDA